MTDPFSIIYQDEQLIAVCKPTGIPVENDTSGDASLFDSVRYRLTRQQLLSDHDSFLGVVHRIDRPVGGLVLFARTPEALRRLHRCFRDRRVQKRYWAIVEGQLPADSGRLEGFLSNDRRTNKAHVHPTEARDRKQATLDYRVAGHSERYTFVEIDLHTGRHHQIRAQLAAAGAPIKGDLKYGARRSNPGSGICLFARSLELSHPMTGAPLALRAEPPHDPLWDLFPRG